METTTELINVTVDARAISVSPIRIEVNEVNGSLNFYLSTHKGECIEVPCDSLMAALTDARQEYIENKHQSRVTGGKEAFKEALRGE